MLKLKRQPVSINVVGHLLGTSKGFVRLPMFIARKETSNTLIIEDKGSIFVSQNKFERRRLEKVMMC